VDNDNNKYSPSEDNSRDTSDRDIYRRFIQDDNRNVSHSNNDQTSIEDGTINSFIRVKDNNVTFLRKEHH